MFSKRHYEVLATMMQRLHPGALGDTNRAVMQWGQTVSELAAVLAADNPKFKRDRFVAACRPGANVRARG